MIPTVLHQVNSLRKKIKRFNNVNVNFFKSVFFSSSIYLFLSLRFHLLYFSNLVSPWDSLVTLVISAPMKTHCRELQMLIRAAVDGTPQIHRIPDLKKLGRPVLLSPFICLKTDSVRLWLTQVYVASLLCSK